MSNRQALLDLLPSNIDNDVNVHVCAEAIEPNLAEVDKRTDVPTILSNIDISTGLQLDHVAYAFDASTWRDSWPIELKRSVVRNAVIEKRKRGTLWAVKEVLRSFGSASTITEWWQENPKGRPHTFTVTATLSEIEGVFDEEHQTDLMTAIDFAKPVRSHYTLVLVRSLPGRVAVKGGMRTAVFTRLSSLDKTVHFESPLNIDPYVRLFSASRISSI